MYVLYLLFFEGDWGKSVNREPWAIYANPTCIQIGRCLGKIPDTPDDFPDTGRDFFSKNGRFLTVLPRIEGVKLTEST